MDISWVIYAGRCKRGEKNKSSKKFDLFCSSGLRRSGQTLPRSSTHAQSHLGMPNRRNKVTKNGNGPSEGLFAGTPVQP
ncbi:hypothetical protein TNCV_2721671 [Trichonephila clavipes]|nr:hypothetical protein TNCV_2721671 [Trichonephila clavipes]